MKANLKPENLVIYQEPLYFNNKETTYSFVQGTLDNKVLIVLEKDEHTEQNMAILQKMLAAIELPFEQAGIILTQNNNCPIDILQSTSLRKLILFNVGIKNLNRIINKNIQLSNFQYIETIKISDLMQDNTMKKTFWTALKKFA